MSQQIVASVRKKRKTRKSMTDDGAPKRPQSSGAHRLNLGGGGREPNFTLDQEKIIRHVARKVFKEQFESEPKPQVSMGRALGNMSQSSVSALINGHLMLGIKRAEALAQLAGYDSLKEMIGEYTFVDTSPTDANQSMTATSTPSRRYVNLQKCLDFYGSEHWDAWTIACAKAGIFGEVDVEPKQWEQRLNDLESYLHKYKPPK